MKKTWTVQLEDGPHTVEFKRGTFSSKHTIHADGLMVSEGRSYSTDFGSDDVFQIGRHMCGVHVRTNGLTSTYDLSVDGLSVKSGQPVPPRSPLPKWSWLFVGACLAIPIVSLGGVIPAALGGGGASLCVQIARSSSRSKGRQIASSVAVAIVCWALFIGLIVATPGVRTLLTSTQTTWQEFASSEGGYSVQMPGQPAEKVQATDTAAGSIDIHIASFEDRSGAYMSLYSDFPANLAQLANPQKILDGSRDGAVKNVGGKLVSERNLPLNQYPGREIQVDVPAQGSQPAMFITARYYLVDQRMYQVMVVATNTQRPSEDGLKFLDSFNLLKK